jgi:hypothetical protein
MSPTLHEVSGAQRLRVVYGAQNQSLIPENHGGFKLCGMAVEPSGYSTVARGHGGGSNTACEVLFDHKFKFKFYPRRPRNIISIYGEHHESSSGVTCD